MKVLRSKFWVIVLFGLISLGQAYPYSYAYSMSRQDQCGCNLQGRQCIHGCEFRKTHRHQAMHGHDHHGHGANAHASMQYSHQESKHAFHIQEAKPTADGVHAWVNPNCSKQKERKVLSFHGDPFLIAAAPPLVIPVLLAFDLPQSLHFSQGESLPEAPPPRFL